jgi:hypothetical protein
MICSEYWIEPLVDDLTDYVDQGLKDCCMTRERAIQQI